MEEQFLTVAEVAELLKLNPQTIRNWIDARSLPATHVGRRVRIKRSELEAFIDGRSLHDDQPAPAPDPISPTEGWQRVVSAARDLEAAAGDEPRLEAALRALAAAAQALADVAAETDRS